MSCTFDRFRYLLFYRSVEEDLCSIPSERISTSNPSPNLASISSPPQPTHHLLQLNHPSGRSIRTTTEATPLSQPSASSSSSNRSSPNASGSRTNADTAPNNCASQHASHSTCPAAEARCDKEMNRSNANDSDRWPSPSFTTESRTSSSWSSPAHTPSISSFRAKKTNYDRIRDSAFQPLSENNF